jgi:hypothetical protein
MQNGSSHSPQAQRLPRQKQVEAIHRLYAMQTADYCGQRFAGSLACKRPFQDIEENTGQQLGAGWTGGEFRGVAQVASDCP